MFNQKLAEPIVNSETGEIVVDEGTVLDRRKLDEIMDVLETNANSEVFELEGSVIDEPVEIQSIKIYVTMKKVVRLLSLVMHYLILKLNVLLQRYCCFNELFLQLIEWHWLYR